MDVSHLLDPLNEAQRDAVAAPPGPTLVLAGAGSGKTRVLTHRIAWLVETLDVSPLSVLAVTFTNKAAHEMRGRIENILGFSLRGMWIGTFHGICHRLRLCAGQAVADAVNSTNPHAALRKAKHILNSPAHFLACLIGETHSQDRQCRYLQCLY